MRGRAGEREGAGRRRERKAGENRTERGGKAEKEKMTHTQKYEGKEPERVGHPASTCKGKQKHQAQSHQGEDGRARSGEQMSGRQDPGNAADRPPRTRNSLSAASGLGPPQDWRPWDASEISR